MKIPQDDQFRAQAARHELRFTCESCAYFNDERSSCVHGYPTAEHRLARYADQAAPLLFCKEFDLV